MKVPLSRSPRPARSTPSKPAEVAPTPSLLTLDIEKVVAGGLGLARHEGGVVLVRGALGGERVQARVQAGRGVRQGTIVTIIQPSPERAQAPDLPTTDLAHASYPEQLRIKRELVVEALSRIAKIEHPVSETVPSPREWAYRNGAQYLVTPGGLAYRQRRGHNAWNFETDPLVIESLAAVTSRLDASRLAPAQEIAFRGSLLTGEVVAALIGPGEPRSYLRAADHLLDAGVVGVTVAEAAHRRFTAGLRLITGEASVQEQLGDVQVSVSATGFAQVNPAAAGAAYRLAASLAGSGSLAVDLYGGSGAIARHLAPNFGKVLVLDSAPEALKRGQQDVRASGQRNLTFRRANADELVSEMPGADAIIVDPPRAGLSPEARAAIMSNTAKTLVYVSCDPATWARDVGELVRGGWVLGEVVPHDFYPQTSHVEVVSRLTRA
jgi:23S rRNA (uracil1939-C5)-methyltransferase